jgi:hypothetical protein
MRRLDRDGGVIPSSIQEIGAMPEAAGEALIAAGETTASDVPPVF